MPDVLIRKQKIRIEAGNEKLALEYRQFVNETLNDELSKMYDRLFNQRGRSEDYVIVDSLKIDLGVVSATDFYNHTTELVEQKLINELKKQFEAIPGDYKADDDHSQSSPIGFATGTEQNVEAVLCFLQNGAYPWWYKKSQRKEPARFLCTLSSTDEERFLLKVITKVRSSSADISEKFLKRLVDHLEPSVVHTYIHKIAHLYSDNSLELNINTLLDKKEQLIQLFNISLKELYEQALRFILPERSYTHFFADFFRSLMAVSHLSLDEVRARATKVNLDPIFFDTSKVDTMRYASGNSFNEWEDTKIKTENVLTPSSRVTEEGIYIENAGLILLHPFFIAFFQGLGLLNDDDEFQSDGARDRAVVLLYYLQGYSEGYNEWEMPLNKVLCGMSVHDILPTDIHLSATEKEEAKSLLQSVVNHWDALKGSSVEAMQNTFIMREGKLTYNDNYWFMQVERSGVDILLERLPWGIGTIKLPWLKELIYTEW